MRLHADGNPQPFGRRGRRFKDLSCRLQPGPAAGPVTGERPAEDPDQRRLPLAGQLKELAQLGTWVLTGELIELSTATTGNPAAAIVRFTCARSAELIAGSISSPSMSRSSTPSYPHVRPSDTAVTRSVPGTPGC